MFYHSTSKAVLYVRSEFHEKLRLRLGIKLQLVNSNSSVEIRARVKCNPKNIISNYGDLHVQGTREFLINIEYKFRAGVMETRTYPSCLHHFCQI